MRSTLISAIMSSLELAVRSLMPVTRWFPRDGAPRNPWAHALLACVVGCGLTPAAAATAAIPAERMPVAGWNPGVRDASGRTFAQLGEFQRPINLTKVINVRNAPYNAVGDGVADDTAAIQAAIAAGADSIIYLPAGTYKVTQSLELANPIWPWDFSSKILRGAGPGSTVIKSYASNCLIDAASGGWADGAQQHLLAPVARGATTITLAGWDDNLYTSTYPWAIVSVDNAHSGLAGDIPGYMVNTKSQIVRVTSFNRANRTITIDAPLNYAYDTNATFTIFFSNDHPLGIEDLTIENAGGANTHNIRMAGVFNAWISNVESRNAMKWHVRLEYAARCTLDRLYVHGYYPSPGNGGGDSVYGVGLFNRCADNLIVNSIFDHCRHAMITEYGGQGNVFAYNYSRNPINEGQEATDYLMGDICTHGGTPSWNLWEGNVASTIKFDCVLGGGDYNTTFRNQIQRKGIPATYVACFAADIQRWNYHANLVGDVLAVPPVNYSGPTYRWGTNQDDASNPDPNSQATAYLHGVYDMQDGSTTWNSGNPDHALPASLWLTSKPIFWDGGAWPAIGPELSPKDGANPAMRRFLGIAANPAPAPVPPVSAALIAPERQIAWQAGIPGGIPSYPLGVNVKNAPYNAVGNGIADDTAAIRQAIAACPLGSAVLIPAGIYRITGTLSINKGIALRGEGIGKTTLRLAGANGFTMIYVNTGAPIGAAVPVTSGATKDSTSITVATPSAFSAGDIVCLRQKNPAYVSVTGDNGTISWASRNDSTRAMSQLDVVTAKNGSTLTLARPCYVDMTNAPELRSIALMAGCGVEEMSLERTSGTSGDDGYNISLDSVTRSWIRNVASKNTGRAHFRITLSFRCEIRGCTADSSDSAYEHDGDHAYGYFLFDWNSDHLVEDNIAIGCRHSLIFEGGGSGNVIAYNFTTNPFQHDVPPKWLAGDLDTHGAHPFMNLFEGNCTTKLAHDNTFGSASHNTTYRGYFLNDSAVLATPRLARWAIDIQNHSWYNNIVGCVIGRPGDTGVRFAGQSTSVSTLASYRLGFWGPSTYAPYDANVQSTTLIHGTYDYIGGTTTWDPSTPDHNLPASLYLSGKPAWWGTLRWPAYGPDLSPMIGKIPAQARFEGAVPVPVNHAPVANPQSATTAQNTAKAITLSGSDADGDALTYAITANPLHGSLTGSGANRTYTPTSGYAGTDGFAFTVNDGTVSSSAATVAITISAPTSTNQAPTVSIVTAAPSPVTVTTTRLSATATDDGGEPALTYAWSATGPAPVVFSPNGSNAAKVSTATFTKPGSYTVTFSAKDAGALSGTKSVAVMVSATPRALSINPTGASVQPGMTVDFNGMVADQFNITLTTQPALTWTVSGGGTINANGLFTAGAGVPSPSGGVSATTYVVTATAGSVSGTALVTVSTASTALAESGGGKRCGGGSALALISGLGLLCVRRQSRVRQEAADRRSTESGEG